MARDPGRLGCAFESAGRGELVIGTASGVRRWLLVEQPGAWGASALTESHFPADAADRLGTRAREHGVRVLLVRRSMLATDPDGPASAFLVHSGRRHRWAERVELDRPADAADLDLATLASPDAPGIGEPAAPLHLVCTHGRHDPCCADLGRPVARALRDAEVDMWETSHVGGDRFAANLVCLPTGVYFGRVPPERAAAIVRDHDAGLLDLDHYRGRSCFPPIVQAAEILARQALGERRLDELTPRSWERHTEAEGGQVASVVLAHGPDQVEVEVSRRRGPVEQLTCGPAQNPTWRYELASLVTSAGGDGRGGGRLGPTLAG